MRLSTRTGKRGGNWNTGCSSIFIVTVIFGRRKSAILRDAQNRDERLCKLYHSSIFENQRPLSLLCTSTMLHLVFQLPNRAFVVILQQWEPIR